MSVKQMALVWDLDLAPNKRLVLLAYADHADDEGGSVFPSLARVAHKTGYSRDQVRRISRELAADNLMVKVAEATHNKGAEYRLTLERGSKLPPLTPRGVGANDPPRVGAPVPPEPSVEPSLNTPNGVEAEASPGIFVAYLREELDGADVPLLRNREERYAGEFNKLIKKGIGTDILYKLCDRIAERWRDDEHRKLTGEQALEDVVNGKPPANVTELPEWKRGTPAEVIDYVFENAKSSYIRNCERRLRSTMARFDFTSSEQPPWKIEKELGGTDNERRSTLDALHSLCRRAEREMGVSA